MASADEADAAKLEFYKQRIESVLKQRCFECHSHAAGESAGQLMLDSSAAVLGGGSRGAAVVPGKAAESWLIKAIEYHDSDLQMPPDGKLPDATIEDFKKWVADGAVGLPAGSAIVKKEGERITRDTADQHWAYRLPQRATPPNVESQLAAAEPSLRARWEGHLSASNDIIDRLIRSQLLAAGIEPNPTASRRELIRRAHYDLTGLPPTAEDVRQFETDPRPLDAALATLIDRLLASPHFGERWARYWMDVARYADTKGYVFQEDRNYPEAYRYRDWLINAFNENLAFDEFVKLQLAADRIDPENVEGRLPALGFLTLGRRFLNNKNDIIDDRLDVTSRGLMGLTLACARCHDHKYDPVSQADYYAMYGVFLNTDEPGGAPWPHRITDSGENRKSHILLRGQPGNRGAEVPRRFVSFLDPAERQFEQGSGRDLLAANIVSPENPLTSRVFVNRVWMRLLGASLVDSPSDFGARCPAPKQQAVLDQLAVDFVADGWDIKHLIRRLMLTAVYQQSSVARPEAAAVDAENSLYWRMNRRRMDFESLRDATLAVAGGLDMRVAGPSEKIHEAPYSHRRTVYAHIDRQNLPGIFRNFDVASPDAHSPQRLQTTVPQQGLFLLNSGFETNIAKMIGESLQHSAQGTAEAQAESVKQLFVKILAREPDQEELAAALDFLASAPATGAGASVERWICGFGSLDAESGRVTRFERLPNYTGKAWQGGSQLPDPKLGWTMLNAEGGHPGGNLDFVAIRKWVAPQAGKLSIRGKLNHPSDQGDGVRATVTSERTGKLAQWQAKKQEVGTEVLDIHVEAGEAIYFVVDSLTSEAHDGFQWRVRLKYADGGPEFVSAREFPAPVASPLGAWDQLAQALLASNEFAFID